MTKENQIAKLKKLGDEFIYALIDNPYECPIVIDNRGIIVEFPVDVSKAAEAVPPTASELKVLREVVDPQRIIL